MRRFKGLYIKEWPKEPQHHDFLRQELSTDGMSFEKVWRQDSAKVHRPPFKWLRT